jgi:hypothetical protein
MQRFDTLLQFDAKDIVFDGFLIFSALKGHIFLCFAPLNPARIQTKSIGEQAKDAGR